jgi:hypothetical protein
MKRSGDARREEVFDWNKALSFPVKMTQKIYPSPRNIWEGRFVYTSAAGFQAVAGWTEI